jgi:hypothetical protein
VNFSLTLDGARKSGAHEVRDASLNDVARHDTKTIAANSRSLRTPTDEQSVAGRHDWVRLAVASVDVMEKPKNLAFGDITTAIDIRLVNARVIGDYEAT